MANIKWKPEQVVNKDSKVENRIRTLLENDYAEKIEDLSYSELGIKDITLYRDDIYLSFMFAGNLDLYWVLENYSDYSNEEIRTDSFIITKENYAVYLLFEEFQ